MFDLNHLPNVPRDTVQTFQNPTAFGTWIKPRGINFVHIFCMGAGGGGGGGFTRAAAAAGSGGGGGGSGGQATLTIPAYLLPDRLFIIVGAGGRGGTGSGVAGAAGGRSFVLINEIAPLIATNTVAYSGAADAGGGGAGSAAAVGAAGAASTVPTAANTAIGNTGHLTVLVGSAGTASGAVAGAVGGAVTIPATGLRCVGGSGGGSTTSANFAGGLVTAISNSALSNRRPQLSDATTIHGCGGFKDAEVFFFWGGLGGWAINAGPGGNGGSGATGSGGGGGGAGTTGGAGGNGGNGIVIITCW